MNQPRVYMCSPSWPSLPRPSPSHPSGSYRCTSPEHPVPCIEQLPSFYLPRLRFSTKRTFLPVVKKYHFVDLRTPSEFSDTFPGWAAPEALTWYRSCLSLCLRNWPAVLILHPSWNSTPFSGSLDSTYGAILNPRVSPVRLHPPLRPIPLSFPEAQTPVSRGPGDIQYNSWEAGAAAAHHSGGGEDAGGGVGAADRWDLQVLQSEALVRHLPHRRRPPPHPTSPSASPSQRRGGIREEPERGPPRYTAIQSALTSRPATNR